jgi:CheY-like chemotaxis protein
VISSSKYRIPEFVLTGCGADDGRMFDEKKPTEQAERKIRALIVDDSPLMIAKLRELLATLPQVEIVAEAVNGEEALRQAKHVRPDFVVMDIQMPVMGGFEAARKMEILVPGVFIVLTSAFSPFEPARLPPSKSVEFASKSRLWDLLPRLLSARFPDHK